jgi:hypothetical protein
MSQKIYIRPDDGAYSVIVCDHCGEPITDAKDGNAVWRESSHPRRKEQFIPIQHTHKRCNWLFMHRRFPEPDDGSWMWMSHELTHDLFMLLLNVEFNLPDAERQARMMAMFD